MTTSGSEDSGRKPQTESPAVSVDLIFDTAQSSRGESIMNPSTHSISVRESEDTNF